MFKLNPMSYYLLHSYTHNWPPLIPRHLHPKAFLASARSLWPLLLLRGVSCLSCLSNANLSFHLCHKHSTLRVTQSKCSDPFKREGRGSKIIQKAIQWHVILKLESNCFISCSWMLYQIEWTIWESPIVSFQVLRLCIDSVETYVF